MASTVRDTSGQETDSKTVGEASGDTTAGPGKKIAMVVGGFCT